MPFISTSTIRAARLLRSAPFRRSFASPTNLPSPCVDSDNSVPNPPTDGRPATLHLKSGHTFTGRSFGAPLSRFGEAVFSTSTTRYDIFRRYIFSPSSLTLAFMTATRSP